MTTTSYADVLERSDATGDDAELMDQGCHFDYVEQRWVDGHDHAHYDVKLIDGRYVDGGPLWFCGADMVTCCGKDER